MEKKENGREMVRRVFAESCDAGVDISAIASKLHRRGEHGVIFVGSGGEEMRCCASATEVPRDNTMKEMEG